MEALFDPCLNFTLAQEGGFADNPADPGGATFKGITLASLRTFWKAPNTSVAELKALSAASISNFYECQFWVPIRCGVVPAGIDLMLFDHGVNAGAGRPVPMMQRILGVDDDGDIGPITLAAIASRHIIDLIGGLRDAQEAYYRGLREFPTFGNGWLNRLSRRYTAAIRLVGTRAPAAA